MKALALVAAIVVVSTLVQAVIEAPAVAIFYPDVSSGLFAASVLGNGVVFPLAFSLPLIILMQEEIGFAPFNRKRVGKASS